MSADEALLIRRIAAVGLPGESASTDGQEVRADAWPRLLGGVLVERATGLAVAAALAGRVVLTEDQFEELCDHHRLAMAGVLNIERTLLSVSSALEEAEIRPVVLKGSALAHCCYPDPSWRSYGDLDLLIRGQDWERAGGVLRRLGYGRNQPEPRPGFDRRFGVAAVYRKEGSAEIDVHRRLVAGPFGLWLDHQALPERTVQFTVGGRSFSRLDDTHLLIHACIHASLGYRPPLLLPLRDVAQCAFMPGVDWDLFRKVTAAWKLTAVVSHAFGTVQARMGDVLPKQAAAFVTSKVSRRERRALEAYTTDRRMRGGKAVTSLMAIPGARDKVAYIRALTLPSRDFVTARNGQERGSYLRRWMVPMHWLAGSGRS